MSSDYRKVITFLGLCNGGLGREEERLEEGRVEKRQAVVQQRWFGMEGRLYCTYNVFLLIEKQRKHE